jgi:TonB family protein
MMKLSTLILAVALALAWQPADAADEGKDKSVAEGKLEDLIDSIPVNRVPTTTDSRKKQRSAGQRVMLVEGRPGYLYRDYLQANISGLMPGPVSPILRIPQENPDVPGCVTVTFEIRPDGKTDAFEIVKSEPPGVFDQAALRVLYATEYEPRAAGSSETPAAVRHQRSIWFLIARARRAEFSKVNEAVEESRNRRREQLRAACEGEAS